METTPNSWKRRRRFMVAVIGFCMGCVAYVLGMNMDSESAQTAVSMSFVVIGSTIGSYVFGATWDDSNTRKPK